MALLSLIALALSTVGTVVQQRKASEAQRKSTKLSQRRADIQATRDRREQVRAARIQRAEILSTAANTGAAGSSSEAGAIGSIQTQLGSNIGTSFLFQDISQRQSSANVAASAAQSRAATFSSIGNLAGSFVDPKTAATDLKGLFR